MRGTKGGTKKIARSGTKRVATILVLYFSIIILVFLF